ncbi:MAG: hypothetical protein CMF48_03060 [Legionellales bacterium]|nr:hypothetical protein [Legionellales bacterium]
MLSEVQCLQLSHLIALPLVAEEAALSDGSAESLYKSITSSLVSLESISTDFKLALLDQSGEKKCVYGGEIQQGQIKPNPLAKDDSSPILFDEKANFRNLSIRPISDNRKKGYTWSVSFELTKKELPHINPVPFVNALFSRSPIFHEKSSLLTTVIAEMYSNAIEHGVLGLNSDLKKSPDGIVEYYEAREKKLNDLSSGYVKISLTNEFTPERKGMLIATLEDSGKGFDFEKTLSTSKSESTKYFGRGFKLIRDVCSGLDFKSNGSQVTVHYSY